MPIFDISQTLTDKIAVWPGDQKFRVRWSMRLRQGDACNVSAITMSVHTGTHLDAPYHFDDSGADIAGVDLAACMGPARVCVVPDDQLGIGTAFLERHEWQRVERVLFRTRASALPTDKFPRDYQCLTQDGAEFLGRLGLRLVGIDSPSLDAFDSKTMTCHKILLSSGVTILEGVRLERVPPGDYELICLPLKLAGLDGSPVRAILRSRD